MEHSIVIVVRRFRENPPIIPNIGAWFVPHAQFLVPYEHSVPCQNPGSKQPSLVYLNGFFRNRLDAKANPGKITAPSVGIDTTDYA